MHLRMRSNKKLFNAFSLKRYGIKPHYLPYRWEKYCQAPLCQFKHFLFFPIHCLFTIFRASSNAIISFSAVTTPEDKSPTNFLLLIIGYNASKEYLFNEMYNF